MAIYVDGTKCKFVVDGTTCGIVTYAPDIIITNGVRLLSSDDYILKDIHGLYLTIKKEDE